MSNESVWVFVAPQAQFPSGVFASSVQAEEWIGKHRLTGLLTEYPVGSGVFDWAIERGHFKPKPEKTIDAKFIGRFTTAALAHSHYENGALVAEDASEHPE